MGDRGRQLAHRRDAVGVREFQLRLAEGLFGALTLDELTDLAADSSQHVEQLLTGLPDLATEKLDHAQDFPPDQDGKAEGRGYSFAFGDVSPRKVFISNTLGNEFGP